MQLRIVGSDAFLVTIAIAGEVFGVYAVCQLRSQQRRGSRLFWIVDLTVTVVMLLAFPEFYL